MRVTCIQMDMAFGQPEKNFEQAEALVRRATKEERPDVIVLPELWNIGFFPRQGLKELCDLEGQRTKALFSSMAKELGINIVAGSVAVWDDGRPYNSAFAFDRQGKCLARYDKTHLFSPSGEHEFFQPGDSICTFRLDGVDCGLLICYDLRFPELVRSLALRGIEMLFLPAQWPVQRVPHLSLLCEARAVENQMFVVSCNSCGADDGGIRFGGHSSLIDPWGKVLARAQGEACIFSAELDLSVVAGIRGSINVFQDRRPDIYSLN